MYNYYYIKTDCLSNTWNTFEIRDFLCKLGFFEEELNGIFYSETPYLSISLMKVKDVDSWSCLDYNEDETNYVSIITSEYSEGNMHIGNILKSLEQFFGFRMRCDD